MEINGYSVMVPCLLFCSFSQIEVVNDRIGMVYSGMGPDFRWVLYNDYHSVTTYLSHYPYTLY